MERLFFLLFSTLILLSCKESDKYIVQYTYDGVTVSRYDEGKDIYFYYDKTRILDNLKRDASIVFTLGNDDSIGNDLVFNGKKVTLIDDGNIYEVHKNSILLHLYSSIDGWDNNPLKGISFNERYKLPNLYSVESIENEEKGNKNSLVQRVLIPIK